ncbi:MAG: hypothetical protein IKF51_07995 [Solobacterium sp.]|nr:hypothetical protein [Solobacterium sp.]
MKRILLGAMLILLLSEGLGSWFLDRFHLTRKGFCAPYGFAVMLGTLQLLYYPAQLLHLSFTWIIAASALVFLFALLVTLKDLKRVLKGLLRPQMILVVLTAVIFFFVLRTCSVDMNFADSSAYLNYIAMNINADHLNLYDITNGLRGSEWLVLYSYQGYHHFASFVCWLCDLPFWMGHAAYQLPVMTISIYLFGLIYNVLSTMLIIDAVDEIRFKDYGFKAVLLIFLLFYSNFAYWDISFAFYGNTFRNLFIMVMIRVIMIWLDSGEDSWKYLIPLILSAGLACSSSYMFMGFAVLYALAAYLFRVRKENALSDMMLNILPMVIYALTFIVHTHPILAAAVLILYVVLLFLREKGIIRRMIGALDMFLEDHDTAVFFVGVPLIFVIGSAVITVLGKQVLVTYATYLDDFTGIDMTRDFLFIHSDWLNILLNICRWGGYFLLVFRRERSGAQHYLADLCILLMIFFLNPLCIVMLEATMTGHVFYRNFLTLFNPLTEAVFFVLVYEKISTSVPERAGLKALLCIAVILGNVGSYLPSLYKGQYWIYVRDGKEEDPYYKMEMDEYNALQALISLDRADPKEEQTVLLSHSPSTLTYLPEAYQIFTPRNEWFVSVDEDFFEIARRHFSWREEGHPQYEKTCDYIEQYGVDYIVVQYWENPDYDAATDGCSVTMYEGSKFKVKKAMKQD